MTETTADRPTGRITVQTLPLAIAAILGIAGARLTLNGGQLAISGGVLLMAGALVAAGVAIGGAWSPGTPAASDDLSSRIGLGLLGGVFGGLLHATLTVAAGWFGVTALLGAGIDVQLTALDWWNRAAIGGLLGVALGAVYPLLPKGSFIRRGTTFALVFAAWQLFYVYPFRLGLGLAGMDAGWSVPLFVAAAAVMAGVVAAWFVARGGRAHDEPLSAPLVP